MRTYRVISSFVERNEDGEPTGRRPQPGEIISLPDNEAARLVKALCVEEMEARVVETPENRVRRRRLK